MIAMPDEELIRLQVTDRVWNAMYAAVDNAVDLAAGECDPDELDDDPIVSTGAETIEVLSRPRRIAEPDELQRSDGIVAVALPRHQWLFILDQSDRGEPIYERLGDEASLALIRDVRATITTQLGIA
jgi:hypothetical protein